VRSFGDSPSARFFGTGGKEGNQVKEIISLLDNNVQPTVRSPQKFEIFGSFFRRKGA
jgi:hypothetical protein